MWPKQNKNLLNPSSVFSVQDTQKSKVEKYQDSSNPVSPQKFSIFPFQLQGKEDLLNYINVRIITYYTTIYDYVQI